jgi:para-nitrobenzyl esterase
LCERGDVVLVTINYRLGVFGYLSLLEHGGSDWGATANAGQLDQIAALRWVQGNIERFGGDPANVTIFGESAGSMAVCTLLAMPEAKGLFHRAIAQSGANVELSGKDRAAELTSALLDKVGLGNGQAERLRGWSAEELIAAQMAVGAERGIRLGLAPIVDGTTLPDSPGEIIAAGASAEVPLVIGTNRDEMNLFVMPLLKQLDQPMGDEAAAKVISRDLPALSIERAIEMLAVYRKSREARGLPSTNRALLGALQTDLRFRIPSLRYAEAYRNVQPGTFVYYFTYESPAMRGTLRACHALEIPFVFGTLSAPFQDRFAGTGPDVERLSETMMDAWIAFARSGAPQAGATEAWRPYETTTRPTMVFDRQSQLEEGPYDEERAAWDGLL